MEQKKRISNIYNYEKTDKDRIICDKETDDGRSRTHQSMAKEVNINTIMEKYRKTGLLTDPLQANGRQPFFGDFTNGMDFQDMQYKIAQINEAFSMLPAGTRAKFENNPQMLLDYIANPANKEEAIKLGILPAMSQAEADELKAYNEAELVKERAKIEAEKVAKGATSTV